MITIHTAYKPVNENRACRRGEKTLVLFLRWFGEGEGEGEGEEQ